MAKCRRCRQRIEYIKTYSGTLLAVNPEETYYKHMPGSYDKIVTPNGEVLPCILLDGETDDLTEATAYGYRPHSKTCPAVNRYRKGRR